MFRSVWAAIGLLILFSCAQKGSPSGGPRDYTPPRFLKSTPDTFATNVGTQLSEIRIEFDEYFALKDPQKQVIISPPLASFPNMYPTSSKPRKYLLIELKDSLEPNTTYNINFGESIADINEGNVLPFFKFIFSTGEAIDSLSLSGRVKQALSDKQNLNTVLALYRLDTAKIDLKSKPYYITKIDSTGRYEFDYLHEGKFKLVGFTDENNNLRYDPDELIAFSDSLVDPANPQNYTLTLAENKPDYKIVKSQQNGEGELEIIMQGKPKTFEFIPVEGNFVSKYQIIHKAFSDTAHIFFNAKDLPFQDTKERLKFQVKADEHPADTISLLYDKKTVTDLKLKLKSNLQLPEKSVYIESTNAIEDINRAAIGVFQDSLSLDYEIQLDTINPKWVRLKFPIGFEKNYFIELFPGAFKDQMGNTNDSLSLQFKTMAKNEYGNLIVQLNNAPSSPFFFQLMNKDKVVESRYGRADTFELNNLLPGEYYFRILVDKNENGVWDIADFNENKQAEPTFIYEKTVLIRAFWDINETWSIP